MASVLFLPGKNNSFDRQYLFLAGLLTFLAIVLTTMQDILHAYFNQYAFYLSESLLFKSLWAIFFPVFILQNFIIHRLDFNHNFNKYGIITVSTLLCTLLHCILFPLVIFVLSYSFLDHTFYFFDVFKHTLSEDLYKYLLIYGITASALSYKKSSFSDEKTEQILSSQPVSKIVVGTGKNNIIIDAEEILFISSASPYSCIHTGKGKFLHDETLKTILEKLDNQQFVRVHKSTIINLKQVLSYKSRLNGDYDLTIQGGHTVRMSRNYTDMFRKHFG